MAGKNNLNDPSSLFDPDETTLEIVLPDWWSDTDVEEPKKYLNEPEDNVGRSTCFWCNKPTVKKALFNSIYDYCEKCKK